MHLAASGCSILSHVMLSKTLKQLVTFNKTDVMRNISHAAVSNAGIQLSCNNICRVSLRQSVIVGFP